MRRRSIKEGRKAKLMSGRVANSPTGKRNYFPWRRNHCSGWSAKKGAHATMLRGMHDQPARLEGDDHQSWFLAAHVKEPRHCPSSNTLLGAVHSMLRSLFSVDRIVRYKRKCNAKITLQYLLDKTFHAFHRNIFSRSARLCLLDKDNNLISLSTQRGLTVQ